MTVFDATIKDYLGEIDDAPLLSWEQECELADEIIDNDNPEARDQLVRSNLRLVVSIAKRFATGKLAFADLIEEGNLGLIRAVDSFDPSVGVRFSTYAAWWIKQTIKRALLLDSGPISVPTYMVELVNQYRNVCVELAAQLSTPPSPAQIAEEMKLPLKKVIAISQIVDSINTSGHDDLSPDDDPHTYQNMDTTCNDLPQDEITNAEELAKAVKMLDKLGEREAAVLKLRFGINGNEPLTLKEIGVKLGLTRERVRQLQAIALKQLNELMND